DRPEVRREQDPLAARADRREAHRAAGVSLMRRLMLLTIAVVALAGCRGGTSEEPPVLPPPKWLDHYILPVTNMSLQPKYKPQGQNDFWPNGADMRLPPEGTVARGSLKADPAFYRGVDAD